MLRFRPMLWPTVFGVCALAVLVSLGLWQLERREWKLGLVERIETAIKKKPEPLAVVQERGPDSPEFDAVLVTGHFRHDDEIHLFTHRGSDAGYEIITPLVQSDGTIVLVNRGFVPERLKDPAARAAGQVAGEVTVRGWLRDAEARQWFTPDDDLQKNIWFVRNPCRMGDSRGMPCIGTTTEDPLVKPGNLATFFFVVADETPNPGDWPKGGMELNLRNQHLLYALTWFGLAIVLVGVYIAFHISRGRLGRDLPR